jgi:hypothetical protein
VVAQPGSALAWGARGRWFESSPPDQNRQGSIYAALSVFIIDYYFPDIFFDD